MSENALSTYRYLPSIHRLRDAEKGGPLEALLGVVDEQISHVTNNVREMYDDWFIETCRADMVPYLGELVGANPSQNMTPEVLERLNHKSADLIFPRREVAEAIALRRRKGTLPVLEELAMVIARWHGLAEEWYPRVAQTMNLESFDVLSSELQNQLIAIGQTYDFNCDGRLHDPEAPFGQGAVFPVYRQPSDHETPKNERLIRLHLWRLQIHSLTMCKPACLAAIPLGEDFLHIFTLDPGGISRPLFINPQRREAAQQANPLILPIPLASSLLTGNNEMPHFNYYGDGKSVALYMDVASSPTFIPASYIRVGQLNWPEDDVRSDKCQSKLREFAANIASTLEPIHTPLEVPHPGNLQSGNGTKFRTRPILILDPERGLLALKTTRNELAEELRCSFHFAFSSQIGGGEYARGSHSPSLPDRVIRLDSGSALEPFGKNWLPTTGGICHRVEYPKRTVIEFTDSGTFRLAQESIEIPSGHILELRAGRRKFPTLELTAVECQNGLTFRLQQGAHVVFDGIRFTGAPVSFQELSPSGDNVGDNQQRCQLPLADSVSRVTFRHCTFNPQVHRHCTGTSGCVPHIDSRVDHCVISIEQSIVSQINISSERNASLRIVDSIVDGSQCRGIAINKPSLLRVERSTIVGRTMATQLELAQDSIFTCQVEIDRQQAGGMRFCYVPPESEDSKAPWNTPPQYYCQPSQSLMRDQHVLRACAKNSPSRDDVQVLPALAPVFMSERFGDPGYFRLATVKPHQAGTHPQANAHPSRCCCDGKLTQGHAQVCSGLIVRGAESGSEMGAFHDLFQPQREDNLRRNVDEFTPISMLTELIFHS